MKAIVGLATHMAGDVEFRGDSMVEQNARTALERCDRAYLLVQVANRHDGPGEELLADEGIRREFLGG